MPSVVVTIEHRYDRTPDGAVWSIFFAYDFWARYLRVFDEVQVLARVRTVKSVPAGYIRADGPRVYFNDIPYYRGPVQFLARAVHVRRRVLELLRQDAAVILRVDSQIAAFAVNTLRRQRRPYAVEVVVDPWDVFAPGARRSWLRSVWRVYFFLQLRRQCRYAAAAAYVTRTSLQRRYPPPCDAVVASYSSVQLPRRAFADSARTYTEPAKRIVCVATMDDDRKGHGVLLKALRTCVDRDLNLSVRFVGDGVQREALERAVGRAMLQDRVSFAGQLPSGAAVWSELDSADLFVLPSFGEGLPRSALEAMARALPVLGTRIGGFEEIVSPDALFPPGDARALSDLLQERVRDLNWLNRQSLRNLSVSRLYSDECLTDARVNFYRSVLDQYLHWHTIRRDRALSHIIESTP